jgi:hypothetical protein
MKGKKEFKKRRTTSNAPDDFQPKKRQKKEPVQKKGKRFSIYENWEEEEE